MRFAKILACLAISPLVIGASEPLRLQPSSKWDLDYGTNTCRLIRLFGTGGDETKLTFESIGPGDLTMLVIGKPLYTPKFEPSANARFVPGQTAEIGGRAAVGAKGRDPAGFWGDLGYTAAAGRAAISQSNAVEAGLEGGRQVLLETGSLAKPMQALDKCSNDLLLDFGLDPAQQAKIARPASAPDLIAWLGRPIATGATRDVRRESEVSLRLLVDAAGKITKCTSASRFDAPEYTASICTELMEKARAQPAQLADGTPVPSYVVEHLSFIRQ